MLQALGCVPARRAVRDRCRLAAARIVACLLLAAPCAHGSDDKPASPAATTLESVDTEIDGGTLRITLRGNGRLDPADAGRATTPPARVFVDLLVAAEPSSVKGAHPLLRRIRVAPHTPGTIRVVLDLDRALPYRLERGRDRVEDLVIVLDTTPPRGDQQPAGPPPLPGQPSAPPVQESDASGGHRGTRWFSVRGLRAPVGASYETTDVRVTDTKPVTYADRVSGPIVTVQGTMAIIDPQVLSIDAMADVRLNWRRYRSQHIDTDSDQALQNYRVNFSLLSGRGSPLQLYVERFTSFLDQRQQVQNQPGLDLGQTGRQTIKGFSWDLNAAALPHVSTSGFISNREDTGSFLYGADSDSRQRHFELRADKTFTHWRHDVSYLYDDYRYDYPLLALSTETGYQFLRGTTDYSPKPGLTVSLGGRFSTFAFKRAADANVDRGFAGAGTEAGVSWDVSPRVRVSASHTGSVNEGDVSVVLPGEDGQALAASARRRFWYQDYDGRVTFTTTSRHTSASVFVRGTSLDPLQVLQPTLDTLTLAGVEASHTRPLGGIEFTFGGEVAAGRVTSNRGDQDTYQEAEARLRASRRVGRVSLSAGGGLRGASTVYFYPVGAEAWYGSADVVADVARQFRLRASASRSYLLNDVVYQRGDNHADALSANVSGLWYDAGVEYSETDASTSGLLQTALLIDGRPDVLLQQRPELFGFLWANQQRLRGASLRLMPMRGLEIFGRARLDQQTVPGTPGESRLEQQVGQAGVVWGVRQVQIEIGWQYLDLSSLVATTLDRRFYVRVRRDLPIF